MLPQCIIGKYRVKAGIECTSCFANDEFGAFGTINYIYNAINLAIKMLGNIREAFRSLGTTTGRKEKFYLTTHSTHFIYGYMASDIW